MAVLAKIEGEDILVKVPCFVPFSQQAVAANNLVFSRVNHRIAQQ
jgi:hypothetical protein